MASYILKRIIYMILLLIVLSIASFAIIQLPPGDYLNTYIANLEARRIPVNDEIIEQIRERYGLGQPFFCSVL